MSAFTTQLRSIRGQTLLTQKSGRVAGARARFTPRAAVELPNLPYDRTALEPKISAETLDVHWGKHHRAYVTNLNKQLEETFTDLANASLEEIVKSSWNNGKPTAAFNNAAQIWNHTFYWESMSPSPTEPKGELLDAINASFGSLDEFKKQFAAAGATQFGSGWAWLVVDNGKLAVTKTPNAELPLTSGQTAILTMDVWEHAYYIDVQNRRPDYIQTFINELINWDKVAERYAAAK